MRIRRPSEKTINILKMIAVGILILGAAPSPRALSRIFKELRLENSEKNRRWIKRKLRALHEDKYVSIRNDSYTLSEIGVKLIEQNRLWSLQIDVPKKWDGEWHIVVFDIPKEKSQERIPFTRHLQKLGFQYYQRSVWIHPFPCEDEVREIAVFLDILPFVSFIKATHVDGSHALRSRFEID